MTKDQIVTQLVTQAKPRGRRTEDYVDAEVLLHDTIEIKEQIKNMEHDRRYLENTFLAFEVANETLPATSPEIPCRQGALLVFSPEAFLISSIRSGSRMLVKREIF